MDNADSRSARAGSRGESAEPREPIARITQAGRVSQADRDRLVRLAYRFVWDRDEAEDVVQDALFTAHQRSGDLRDTQKWWPWVCQIVVRRCRLYGRRGALRLRHTASYGLASTRRAAPADDDTPSELAGLVKELLPMLPDRQREVVVLRHLQGMSFEEIGEVLGIAPSTARVHARAGRERLRDLLRDHAQGGLCNASEVGSED